MNKSVKSNFRIREILLTGTLFFMAACSESQMPLPVSYTATMIPSSQTVPITVNTNLPPITLIPPSQTAKASPTLTSSKVAVKSTTLQETEVNSTIWSSYASLPSGLYLVYSDSAKGDGLWATTETGDIQRQFSKIEMSAITLDGRKVIFGDGVGHTSILNLENSLITKLPLLDRGCSYFGGQSNLNKLVYWCNNGEVYVLNSANANSTQITQITREEEYYYLPMWSPDGKWIAMFNLTYPPDPFNTNADDGLYLIDTRCLTEPLTCPKKMQGPFQDNLDLQGPYVWSPDSQELAILTRSNSNPIKIFNIKTQEFRDLNSTEGYGRVHSLAWSPDGLWIAYNRQKSQIESTQSIFLAPIKGVQSIEIITGSESVIVYFWLTVPWPFRQGDTYVITKEGTNLNLRQSPTKTATILRKLHSGDVVRIVSGPVDADGYHWWSMQVVGDSTEGWAVDYPGWYLPGNLP